MGREKANTEMTLFSREMAGCRELTAGGCCSKETRQKWGLHMTSDIFM